MWACWWLKNQTLMIREMINIIILGGENNATSKTLSRISCPTPPISVPSLALWRTRCNACIAACHARCRPLTVFRCARSGCSFSDKKHDEGRNMLIKYDYETLKHILIVVFDCRSRNEYIIRLIKFVKETLANNHCSSFLCSTLLWKKNENHGKTSWNSF